MVYLLMQKLDYIKKIIAIILLTAVLILTNSVWADCMTEEKGETTESNIDDSYIYSLQDNCAIIKEYVGHKINCVIPNTIDGFIVTGIDKYAFYNKRFIQSVIMPNSIEWIGEKAFGCCDCLKEVRLSDCLVSVGTGIFSDCISLRQIEIPKSLKKLSGSMFAGCLNLREVTCSDDLTDMNIATFWGCKRLKSFIVPTGVSEIEDLVFSECSALEEVILPEGIKKIGENAFFNCYRLRSIDLPDTLIEIGKGAFSSCWNLKSMNIPDSVQKIGEAAFNTCRSKMVLIGRSGSAAENYANMEDIAFQNKDTGAIKPCKNPLFHDLFYGTIFYINWVYRSIMNAVSLVYHLFIR